MTALYRGIMTLAVPLARGYFWWRGRKASAYRERWSERVGRGDYPPQSRDGILIHCVSVGETVAARALIEQVIATYPSLPITLTSMTPTADNLARKMFGDKVMYRYLPVDQNHAVKRFIDALQPRAILILETELWPNLLAYAQHRDIPVILLNARLSERSARGYQRWGKLIGPVWQRLSFVATQDQATLERMQALGLAKNAGAVLGNLKLDAQVPDLIQQQGLNLRQQQNRFIWVAASTHAGEDELILAAHKQLLQQRPGSLLIIVPRHPERFEAVYELAQATQLRVQRRSQHEQLDTDTDILVGDTMGELLLWYAAADVAFIGGSLIERGGHNPLEAIAANTAVLSGPHVFNFETLYQRLDAVQSVSWVTDADTLSQALGRFEPTQAQQSVQRAREEFAQDYGATQRMFELVQNYLPVPKNEPHNVPLRTMKMIKTTELSTSHQIWFDSDFFSELSAEQFKPEYWQQHDAVVGAATGRAKAFFIQHGPHQILLRHYYRGGLVGKFNTDRFKREPIVHSRAMAEFALLLKLRELELPVPRPVAAHFEAAPVWGYRADIMVEVIPGAVDIFKRLSEAKIEAPEWQKLGIAIAELHKAGVYHSDLNCHNLMLDQAGKAWIVDFDKCGFKAEGDWREKNLERLLRSFRKENEKASAKALTFAWDEECDWPLLVEAYRSHIKAG
ncbi:lipid IV(A) 3-deoxy-D-manno-octulosonic acid transferase [Pseudidiomarina taiwanensis]|uniref:3-deoxy-D-manno-octulosonic acid kinase n=1 Tax=Pseudidiomarina taiwanensis TaxID=337250 RepID=A0A432ZM54_9GAMM|nr:lipid IV(A) 3-deoxy-D-manno-octulosonic acid transferase [Pseudidiomarina taiwanensis]RUO78961.1 3-deoxy-D-manno-octulosonic acid transferase [Pseudidiomarina taiwanensis]